MRLATLLVVCLVTTGCNGDGTISTYVPQESLDGDWAGIVQITFQPENSAAFTCTGPITVSIQSGLATQVAGIRAAHEA